MNSVTEDLESYASLLPQFTLEELLMGRTLNLLSIPSDFPPSHPEYREVAPLLQAFQAMPPEQQTKIVETLERLWLGPSLPEGGPRGFWPAYSRFRRKLPSEKLHALPLAAILVGPAAISIAVLVFLLPQFTNNGSVAIVVALFVWILLVVLFSIPYLLWFGPLIQAQQWEHFKSMSRDHQIRAIASHWPNSTPSSSDHSTETTFASRQISRDPQSIGFRQSTWETTKNETIRIFTRWFWSGGWKLFAVLLLIFALACYYYVHR